MPKFRIVEGTIPFTDEEGREHLNPLRGGIYDGKQYHECGSVVELSEDDASELLKQGTVERVVVEKPAPPPPPQVNKPQVR